MGRTLTLNRVDWDALSSGANHGRRREARHLIAHEIEVCGFDRAGRFFTETTRTIDAGEWGCKCRLAVALERETIVAIRMAEKQDDDANQPRPVLFRIAYVRREGDGWTVGAAKLQDEPVWPDFVPDLVSPTAAAD